MGLVLRITNWKIVRRAITGEYTPPTFPSLYEYRGILASGKRKGCEVLIPRLESFDSSTLTGKRKGKKPVTFVFQEPNKDWLKYLKDNNISISNFKF